MYNVDTIKLNRDGNMSTNEKEVKQLGIIFSVRKAPSKSGIMRAFDLCGYVFFHAPDLAKFGLKHWRLKELFIIEHMIP